MQHELYHHGVKGQKWGVRRYQNKDGSLTPEGQKRLAKSLKRDYKRNYQYSYPFKTSKTYDEKLRGHVKSAITDEDKKRITDAKKTWLSKQKEADKAEEALYDLAEKFGKEYYDEEIRKNARYYDTPRAKEKLREYSIYDYGIEKAEQSRPDLHEARKSPDKYYDAYKEECRKVSDKLLGEYGNTTLYSCKYYSLTVRDTIGDMVNSLENNGWKN